MHLADLKTAVSEAAGRAAVLVDEGHDDTSAAEVYTALFVRLHARFLGAPAQAPGWPQVVRVVTQLGNRLPLDALESQLVHRLQIRAATLLDLPDVTYLTCLDDIHAPIRADLAMALARRQAGDFRGCCTIHWATGRALLAAQVTRAFSGHARALAPIHQAYDAEPPAHVLDEQGISFYAFTLRVALETALMVTGS